MALRLRLRWNQDMNGRSIGRRLAMPCPSVPLLALGPSRDCRFQESGDGMPLDNICACTHTYTHAITIMSGIQALYTVPLGAETHFYLAMYEQWLWFAISYACLCS